MSAGGLTMEWAEIGKRPEDRGYRVLRCTAGLLSRDNFFEIHNRLSTGTPDHDELPQVRIGWGGREDDAHVVLAVDSRGETDRDGRPVVRTLLYCVPYAALAGRPTSYSSLFEILLPLRPEGDRPVTVAPEPLGGGGDPVVDETARATAALLLNKQPVSVVQAGAATLREKIQFIDRVADYLPFGMRAKFNAATWASGTSEHKVRLTFSQYPRQNGRAVRWAGVPEIPFQSPAQAFLSMVAGRDEAELMRALADQTEQRSFAVNDVNDLLGWLRTWAVQEPAAVAIAGLPPSPYPALPSGSPPPLPYAMGTPAPAESWETLLQRYAEALNADRDDLVLVHARNIRANAARLPEGREQEACRQIVERPGLLERVGDSHTARSLLAVAYPRPLTGAGVARVLTVMDRRPTKPVAEALALAVELEGRLALLQDEPRKQRHLLGGCPDRALINLAKSATDARTIELAGEELAGRHKKGDPELAVLLAEHSFMAPELHDLAPRSRRQQRDILRNLLKAAHGSTIQEPAVFAAALGPRPTELLLVALLAMYRGPDARGLVVDCFYARRLADMSEGDKQLMANLRRPQPPPPPSGGPDGSTKRWDIQRHNLTGIPRTEETEEVPGQHSKHWFDIRPQWRRKDP